MSDNPNDHEEPGIPPEMSEEEFEALAAGEGPNLLPGVQDLLHKRSAGRFYRDRYSRMPGTTTTIWLAAAVILGACALWFLFGG